MNIFTTDSFKEMIEKHLNDYVKETIEEIIKESMDKINNEIRKKTGQIAAQLFKSFDFESSSNRMIITVNFKNLENK